MVEQLFRQPCWAWALQDGRCSSSSSSTAHLCHSARTPSRLRRQPQAILENHHNNLAFVQSAHDSQVQHAEPGAPQNSLLLQQQQQQQQQQQHSHGCYTPSHSCNQYPGSGSAAHRQLPDQKLFQQIKACSSWDDCLQLLQTHGSQLDGMLLSTLCTHTVHLFQVQQYTLLTDTAGQSLLQQQQQQPEQEQEQQRQLLVSSDVVSASNSNKTVCARRIRSSSSNSSSSRTGRGSVAYCQFMLALSQLSLSLACSSTFRPQQYSNVLWCFARCGHRLPTLWVDSYLAQAQQQLVHFQPRNLAQLIWATATLQVQPSSDFMSAYSAASGTQLPRFRAIDLANTLWGLARLEFQPSGLWLSAALAASARCWSQFKPSELSISIWALARLGVRFTCLGLQQQQEQQHQSVRPAAEACASSLGLQESGFSWLLGSIALLSPAMGLQEIANLLWGLAVGRASMSRQEVQALADQLCIILSQSMSHSRPFVASLTVSVWALARLAWAPTLPQAQAVARLLTQAVAAGSLDMKHASILIYSMGKLGLRPPEAVMQYMMEGTQMGMQDACIADILQVLRGCRMLGWRVGKSWFDALYRYGKGALRHGTTAELVHLLATLAASRPFRPTPQWWEAFWDSTGAEIEAAVAARGLDCIAFTRNLPRGNISIAAKPLKTRAKLHGLAVAPEQRRRRRLEALQRRQDRIKAAADSCSSVSPDGGSSSRSSSCVCGSSGSVSPDGGGSSSSSSSEWTQHPLAWVAMAEALQTITNLQGISQGQIQQGQLPPSTLTGLRACVLLWASIRLKWRPPKVLLWQLLLVVVTDVHSLGPNDLAVALWAVARMLHRFGRSQVECFKLTKPLALAAQWRLMVGLAGDHQERRRVAKALRYLASEEDRLMSLLLLHRGYGAPCAPLLACPWAFGGACHPL